MIDQSQVWWFHGKRKWKNQLKFDVPNKIVLD